MTIAAEGIERLNAIYKDYSHSFNGLHNVLWQLMINRERECDEICFVLIGSVNNGKDCTVGLADATGGYSKCALSVSTITGLDTAYDMVENLNAEVFGLSDRAADIIQLRSMSNKA
tara:strand:+ start:1105 stop:1452 length:348 start_codon:yes stop_codon:yes gene_type:complete